MFGITSENALSQARILLVLAIIWLLMALITKKHRVIMVIIYAAIGVLFGLFGLYGIWKSVSGFSLSKIGAYIIAAFLCLLFVALTAAIWAKYQDSPSEKGEYTKSEIYDRESMDDYPLRQLTDNHEPEENSHG